MFQHEDNVDLSGFDLQSIVAMAFVIIVVILLQFIADKNPSEESVQQGNVLVELYWDDKIDTDVDLWVKAPQDVPVGYSNKGGTVFNLLRDDLGNNPEIDVSGKNQEISVSRGIRAGEYVVNAHLYWLGDADLPVSVKSVVSVKPDNDSKPRQLFSVDAELVRECHEKTLIVFTLDSQGNLRDGSVHYTQTNLRSNRACGTSRGDWGGL